MAIMAIRVTSNVANGMTDSDKDGSAVRLSVCLVSEVNVCG